VNDVARSWFTGASTGLTRGSRVILAVDTCACAFVTRLRLRRPPHRPVRLLHRLDAVFTQAALAVHSGGVSGRRQRQRLAVAQRLLDPLPRELHPPDRIGRLFWQGLRWSTLGMLIAWVLRP
jgi:hypothetical protein